MFLPCLPYAAAPLNLGRSSARRYRFASDRMITIVAGTNRPRSRARRLCDLYTATLQSLGAEAQVLDLAELPVDFISTALYDHAGRNDEFNRLANMASQAEKLVFVVPEYNCSFPGVLKAFIDGLPYPGGIRNKKAALVGLSSGTQGGLLALTHLSDVLMYLGTAVLPLRVRLPNIDEHLTREGELKHPLFQELLRQQAEELIRF
ncbi:NADPH-dependent FMN reductase [Solirubrum puertoriconensis]|nr:NAD(P)H-dependent oxidoreductase [Solirubrum puertoriconensis]